jgi:hypothetical protein
MHSEKIVSGRSKKKGRTAKKNRGCCLSIALHPVNWMTVNGPWTHFPTTAMIVIAAISAE